MQKIIEKLGVAKFQVTTPEANNELRLDFNPIIEQFGLDMAKPFKLIHWQGRPKGYREWGVYDSKSDSYSCGVWEDLPTFYGGSKLLMLDDQTATTIPSAVIHHVGSLKV